MVVWQQRKNICINMQMHDEKKIRTTGILWQIAETVICHCHAGETFYKKENNPYTNLEKKMI